MFSSRIEYEEYTKIENAATFTFNKEDHTLANLLKIQLLKDTCVRFSGYTMPSPGVGFPHKFELRVQTDGSKTPTAALQDAMLVQHCATLPGSLHVLSSVFFVEVHTRPLMRGFALHSNALILEVTKMEDHLVRGILHSAPVHS